MSKTLEPYKWYWGYTSPKGITYVFNTYDEAFNHASDKGMFDEIWKHQFEDLKTEFFFEVREDESEEHSPIEFIKENAA